MCFPSIVASLFISTGARDCLESSVSCVEWDVKLLTHSSCIVNYNVCLFNISDKYHRVIYEVHKQQIPKLPYFTGF